MADFRSKVFVVAILATLTGNLFGGVSIRQGKNPVLIDSRGKPFVAKGIVYYQPQAAHNYFLSKVDVEKASADFDLFKTYGFNTVALDINWGELITRVDDTDGYKPIVVNNENIAKLKALVQLAADKDMFVYVLPLNQIVPMEVEASEIIGGYDEAGNYIDTFRGFAVKNWQMDPELNKGFLSFMNLLGKTLGGYDNIVCYCFSYESTEQWWPWCHEDNLLIEGWRKYLKDRNSDVDYWKKRWNEQDADYSEIDEIILPYRDREYWKPYYDAFGKEPVESDPLKWRDYYHFIFVKVCHDGEYGLSIPQMAAAIREGDRDALVMLKNMDPQRYAWELGAVEEFLAGKPLPKEVADIIKKKYSYPGLDMIACDAYPVAHADPGKRAAELTFERDLKRISDYMKFSPLPVFCQEFGCNHEEWSLDEAAEYVANALKGFKRARVLGYNIWQSHDFYYSPQYGRIQANFGIFGTDGIPNSKAGACAAAQGGKPFQRNESKQIPAKVKPPAEPKKLGLSRQGKNIIKDGKPYKGMGVNYFDAFYRVLLDNEDKSYKEGFKVLREQYDIPFARVMFSGFWPNGNKLYFEEREKYFELMDELVAEGEKQKLGLSPSLFWFIGLVPDMMGENMDAYADPASKTHQHMKSYIREVVGRYKDSPAIWAWELGNEWMLVADIPDEKSGRVMTSTKMGSPKHRDPVKDWVKRNDLRVAYRMFADEVRKIDPARMISYGDALPRNSSFNGHFNNSFDLDTKEQFMRIFKGDNIGADCESIHIYPFQDETYFPDSAPIEETIKLCNSTGKPLFIGEFGARAIEGPDKARAFYDRLIKVIVEERVPLSALWVYDFDPQDKDWNVTHDNDRAYMLEAIVWVNGQFKKLNLQ